MSDPDHTAVRLVVAAERLFAEGGEEATSLRAITRAARSNAAAVHYHFGGRDELLRAVLETHLGPLTERRHELLASAGSEPSVESLLDAVVRPELELLARLRDGKVRVARFLGRAHTLPAPAIAEYVERRFAVLAGQVLAKLATAVPAVGQEELRLRLRLVVGAVMSVFATAAEPGLAALPGTGSLGTGPLGTGPLGTSPLGSEDVDEQVRRLVAFCAAGIRADAAFTETAFTETAFTETALTDAAFARAAFRSTALADATFGSAASGDVTSGDLAFADVAWVGTRPVGTRARAVEGASPVDPSKRVTGPTAEPTTKTATGPPTKPPAEAPTRQASKRATGPATEHATQPAIEASVEPVTRGSTETATRGSTEPATRGSTETATRGSAKRATKKAAKFVAKKAGESVAAAGAKPAVAAAKPAAERAGKGAAERAAKGAAERAGKGAAKRAAKSVAGPRDAAKGASKADPPVRPGIEAQDDGKGGHKRRKKR